MDLDVELLIFTFAVTTATAVSLYCVFFKRIVSSCFASKSLRHTSLTPAKPSTTFSPFSWLMPTRSVPADAIAASISPLAPDASSSAAPTSACCRSLVPDPCFVHFMTAVQHAQASKHHAPSALPQAAFRDEWLFLRHAERQDHADRAWRATTGMPETDPPLSAAGRRQALETGLAFLQQQRRRGVAARAKGMLSLQLVSPFHRCIETALIVNIVGFDGALAAYVDPVLSDWHSSRMFSRAPRLAGAFCYGAGGTCVFAPQWDALGAALLPFFRRVAATEDPDGLRAAYGVTPEAAEKWLERLRALLARRPPFAVWTGAAAAGRVAQLAADGEGGGRVALSGVPFPEALAGFLRRVAGAIEQRSSASAGASAGASTGAVPDEVLLAAEREARQLPRVVSQRHTDAEGDTATTATATAAAEASLLPPMRVLVVTHADVIAMALKHCCPRDPRASSGFSVPYCSLTTLSRPNNYYGTSQQDKVWSVDGVGEVGHLLTTILLKFT